MSSDNLANLAKIGSLKAEPPAQKEFDGLLRAARIGLTDAQKGAIAIESRFSLAYDAAHSLALAALRWHGYRSDNRITVFEALPHTLGIESQKWRLLVLTHKRRNLHLYEGRTDVDEKLVAELIEVAQELLRGVEAMGPVPSGGTKG
jgi:hypothetical protein